MSAPWEKYQAAAPTLSGPWSKYAADQSTPAVNPVQADQQQPTFGQTVMNAAKSLSPTSILPNLTPEKLSTEAPVLGAVGGEMLAGPPGAAIGAGAGQIVKRMADVAYGRATPTVQPGPVLGFNNLFSPKEAVGPMIQSAVAGAPGTTEGKAVIQKLGKGAAKVMQAFSGAKASDLERGAQKGYSTYVAPSMDEASHNFGQALEGAGIKTTPSLESTLDPQLTQARETALAAGKKLDLADLPVVQPGSKTGDPHALFAYHDNFGENGAQREIYNVFGDPTNQTIKTRGFGSSVPKEELAKLDIPVVGKQPNAVAISASDALKGRQAVDRIIASTPQKDKPTLLALGQLRDKFNQALASQSPETAAASRGYADAILKRNLTRVMPVNKSGDYSKLAPYLAAAAGSAVGFGHRNSGEGAVAGGAYLLGTSPLAMGAVATTAGMINPVVRQAVLSEFINRFVVGKNGSNQ